MKEKELRAALSGVMAAGSQPPPMSTAQALVTARRARFRVRAAWTCVGSAAAVAVLALGSVVVTGAFSGPGTDYPGGPGPGVIPPPSAGGAATSSPGPWPTGPDGKPQEDRTARAGARYEQGVRLLNEVTAVVPAGYTVPENPSRPAANEMPMRSSQAQFEDRVNGTDVWGYMSSAGLAQGDRVGRLLVEVHTAGNTLTGEPCDLAQKFWGMAGQCQVMTVGAAQVGVVTQSAGDDRFEQWAAYRHPDGVVVFVAQSPRLDRNRPALTQLPFTVEQLAALAIDERFHLQ